MENKKAAFEMSVGTIVTIVLSVTLLVLGIFFVQQIFSSAKGVVDLTDQQLRNEINKLFSEEDKISIYPSTRLIEIKQGSTDGVGMGIRNLERGVSSSDTFSYEVTVSDADLESKCGINEGEVESWMVTGRAENDIPISSGDFSTQKVLFEIPVGAPLCTIRFRIIVTPNVGNTFSDFFDVKVKAK
jgi:uncharacterized membrane protein (Fun14 family)